MSYLLAAWAWVLAHPIIAIAVTTGAASLGYKKLDSYPKWHAFLSLLAGMGLDLPTILDAIRRLFTGSPPTVGKAGPYRTAWKADDTGPQDKPAARWGLIALGVVWMFVLAVLVALGSMSVGCTKQQQVQAVQNFTPAGICIVQQVEAGNVDPLAIIAACGAITIQDIFNEVVALLSTPAGDGGAVVTAPTQWTTHLLTLKANCLKLLAASDAGGGQ